MDQEKVFTLKKKDKAAFLNKLERAKIDTSSHDIVDSLLDDTFKIKIVGADNVRTVGEILKMKTAIDPIKSSTPVIKSSGVEDRLRNIIKEQIKVALKK